MHTLVFISRSRLPSLEIRQECEEGEGRENEPHLNCKLDSSISIMSPPRVHLINETVSSLLLQMLQIIDAFKDWQVSAARKHLKFSKEHADGLTEVLNGSRLSVIA